MRSYRTSLMAGVFTLGLLGAGLSVPASAAPANGLNALGHTADGSGSSPGIILVQRGGGGGGHGGGGGGGFGGGGGGHGGGGGFGGGGGGHGGGGWGGGGRGGMGGGGRGGGAYFGGGGGRAVYGGGNWGGNWRGGHGGHHGRRFFPGFVAGWSSYPYWDDYYYDDYYPDTTVVVGAGGSGVARCEAAFRSFDRSSGTYTTYGGQTKVCPYLR